MPVVVLYRTRPSEPEASEAALAAQRTAVAAWLAEHETTAEIEFTHAEVDGEPPRQFWAALKLCRKQYAVLLIAMTDPIGSGPVFGPYDYYSAVNCVSLTHAPPPPPPPPPPRPPEPVEPATPPAPPIPVPLPEGSPQGLSLWFNVESYPVYRVHLCHSGPGTLTDVAVTSIGTSSHWTTKTTIGEGDEARTVEVPLQTSTMRRNVEVLEPGTAMPLDRYDLNFDADFVVLYEVAYTDPTSEKRQARAVIGTGGPKGAWVKLEAVPYQQELPS